MTRIFILLFVTVFIGCKPKPNKIALPKNLDEAILYFQQNWTKQQLNDFKLKDEKTAGSDVHFAAGLWVRNNWVRGERDTFLTNYFSNLGVYAPDDISSIVFTSLHRVLNNKQINLEAQVQYCKSYWEKIGDCVQSKRIVAEAVYNKFKVGDTISIFMPVDTSGNYRNAILYDCPNVVGWEFDPRIDLLIKGRIVKKYITIKNTSNFFFSLKIDSLNNNKTDILMEPIKVGDTREFFLQGLKIE